MSTYIKYKKIDDLLLNWYRNNSSELITWSDLKLKGKEIAKNLNIHSFKASTGWLARWIKRNGAILPYKKRVKILSKGKHRNKTSDGVKDQLEISKSMRNGSTNSHLRVDELLLGWYKNNHSSQKVTMSVLKLKAKQIANNLKIRGFKATDTWLTRWIKRNGIILPDKTGIQKGNVISKGTNKDPQKKRFDHSNSSRYSAFDKSLLSWYKDNCTSHLITRQILQTKANKIAEDLNILNFKATLWWVRCWTARNGVKLYVARRKQGFIEVRLLRWYKKNCSSQLITRSTLQSKALEIAKSQNIHDFKACRPWLRGWIRKNSVNIPIMTRKGRQNQQPKMDTIEKRTDEHGDEGTEDTCKVRKCGFYRGFKLERIVGMTLFQGQTCFVVKFEDVDEMEVINADVVNSNNPQEVISFYQSKMVFEEESE